jgi:hypothetical protein
LFNFPLLFLDRCSGLLYVLLDIADRVLQIFETSLMSVKFLVCCFGFSSSLCDFFLPSSNITTGNICKAFILIGDLLFESLYLRIETLDRLVDSTLLGL